MKRRLVLAAYVHGESRVELARRGRCAGGGILARTVIA